VGCPYIHTLREANFCAQKLSKMHGCIFCPTEVVFLFRSRCHWHCLPEVAICFFLFSSMIKRKKKKRMQMQEMSEEVKQVSTFVT